MNVTPHFTVEEFASHDGTPYPTKQADEASGETWLVERLEPLCDVLETLRAELGGAPISIISGYRSPAHNARVGGAEKSQHMEGRAADISVKGFTPAQVHAALLALFEAREIEIGGLGAYPGWVHVDVRPRPMNGHLAQWVGAGFGSEKAA